MTERNVATEIAHGRAIAGNAEEVWGWTTRIGRIRLERRVRLLIEGSGVDASKKVLEIGCGTGSASRAISPYCKSLTAIEVSPELLNIAASGPAPENLRYMCLDAHATSFTDGAFDCVVGNSVLHHLNIEEGLKEIYRVLKTGGTLAFAEPNMLNPQILIQKNIPFIKRLVGDSPGDSAIIRFTLAGQLRRLGFVNINIVPFDFLHPCLPEVLIGVAAILGGVVESLPIVKEFAGSVIITAVKI